MSKASAKSKIEKSTQPEKPSITAKDIEKLQALITENQALQVRLRLAGEDDKSHHPELARVYIDIEDELIRMGAAYKDLVLEFDVMDPETSNLVAHKVTDPQMAVWPFDEGKGSKPECCLLGSVPAAKGSGKDLGLVGNGALVTAVRMV